MTPRHRLDQTARREVRARIREHLAARPDVRFAYLHGSFVTREDFSDIDVAVSVEPAGPTGDLTAYELGLAARLERALRLPVDVRVLEGAPLSFQYAATRGETVFVRDRQAWAAFRERTWNAYFDFAPLRDEALRDLTGRL